MGNFRKLKLRMKTDRDLRHLLIKGSRDEILIDLDGDKQADLAIIDSKHDGNIDTVAIDLTGDGEFNLYLVDTDANKLFDHIYFDEKGDGNLELVAAGSEVEQAVVYTLASIAQMVETGEYIAQELDNRLDELEKDIKVARKNLKKLK